MKLEFTRKSGWLIFTPDHTFTCDIPPPSAAFTLLHNRISPTSSPVLPARWGAFPGVSFQK